VFVGYLEIRNKVIITDEEKKTITNGIIDSSLSLMKDITTNQTPKNLAGEWLGTHSQSKTNIARDTVLFNVLRGKQKLPALPRQFRINLDDEEKNIRRWDLRKGVLAYLVDNHILANRGRILGRTRGRPLTSSEIETRGRKDSHYDSSMMKEIVDEVLSDSEAIREIDEALLASPILYEFIKYLWETALNEAKANESAFQNSYKPAIMEYGIRYADKDDRSYILVKTLSETKLKALAGAHAVKMIQGFKDYNKSILYTIAGLVYLIYGYV
jgi:hypothetical protein